MSTCQHTIARPVSVAGMGLHSGQRVHMRLLPAPAGHGIRFVRTDTPQPVEIPASHRYVSSTSHATVLARNGVAVGTVEHVLAALSGLAIDNCRIEINGPEVPILDGSAEPLVSLLRDTAGRCSQEAERRYLQVTRPFAWEEGESAIMVEPFAGFKITCSIDFPHRLIRQQELVLTLNPRTFANRIAPARTFGFLEQIEMLRQNGLALGGSLENAVVLDRFGVLNEEGLRFADEFVRHKLLDCIGDLALLGHPMQGHVVVRKAGHTQHAAFVRALARQTDCWRLTKHPEAACPRRAQHPLPVLPAAPGLAAFRPVVIGKPAF
ncbi:MAG TPA: UDP-3-O-acyl-N-acetylglucosamine deacetylase [Desulfobacterales bacterium]|nr:UDP-3-O-acyl-N-acetylglucosamine deacetylase [Desulfobacterales bacterium]